MSKQLNFIDNFNVKKKVNLNFCHPARTRLVSYLQTNAKGIRIILLCEQRRVDSRLTILYKIRNHLVAIDENSNLQKGTGRREYQYCQLRADKDYTRFSFFPRTVIQWNKLPSQICLAESLDSFKTQVSKIEHSRLN